MTTIRLRQRWICKALLLFLWVIFFFQCPVYSVEYGSIKYNNEALIDYSSINKADTLVKADLYFSKALKTTNEDERKKLLQMASGEYFILTQIEPDNLYYLVQLARVYDYENKNSFAKGYFYNALNIENKNPRTNYYLGEYYYRRYEYTKAIYFYNVAFDNGYGENYEILIKMASMYEKLGDILRANQYYKKAYLLKPGNSNLAKKIKELEQIKYKNTGYYTRSKGK